MNRADIKLTSQPLLQTLIFVCETLKRLHLNTMCDVTSGNGSDQCARYAGVLEDC